MIKLKETREFKEVLDDKLPLSCRATKWACIALFVLACCPFAVFLCSADGLPRVVSDILFIVTFMGALRMLFVWLSHSDEAYIRRRMMLEDVRRTSTE